MVRIGYEMVYYLFSRKVPGLITMYNKVDQTIELETDSFHRQFINKVSDSVNSCHYSHFTNVNYIMCYVVHMLSHPYVQSRIDNI